MNKFNLTGMSRDELATVLSEMDEKSYRLTQIWSWIYNKRVTRFEDMTNISKSVRNRLDETVFIGRLLLVTVRTSPVSKTRKYLWRLADGLQIETVFIPEGKRRTICISTQVGCALGCAFCATGKLGFSRNLTVFEIVGQVLGVIDDVGDKPTNIVVMGMGEPFHNYDNLIKALVIINDQEGLAFSHRKVTISTAGVVPQIMRYAEEGHPFRLAVSLNATTDALRSKLMPVNRKYPLTELIGAAGMYARKSGKRLTFEYVLLKGINDTPEDARRLLKLLKGIPCKVNLIAYNDTGHAFSRPDDEHIRAFAESIRPLSAPVILRLSRGDDIGGACGQLAAKQQESFP